MALEQSVEPLGATLTTPLGSQSPKSVGEDLCKATKDWKGMNVTCKLLVLNRKVTTIPVSAML